MKYKTTRSRKRPNWKGTKVVLHKDGQFVLLTQGRVHYQMHQSLLLNVNKSNSDGRLV